MPQLAYKINVLHLNKHDNDTLLWTSPVSMDLVVSAKCKNTLNVHFRPVRDPAERVKLNVHSTMTEQRWVLFLDYISYSSGSRP